MFRVVRSETPRYVGSLLALISDTQYCLGNYAKALRFANEALEEYGKAQGLHRGRSSVHRVKGRIYHALG